MLNNTSENKKELRFEKSCNRHLKENCCKIFEYFPGSMEEINTVLDTTYGIRNMADNCCFFVCCNLPCHLSFNLKYQKQNKNKHSQNSTFLKFRHFLKKTQTSFKI